MIDLLRLLLVSFCLLFLTACGEDRSPIAKTSSGKQTSVQKEVSAEINKGPIDQKAVGGVSLELLPEQPNALDCLSVQVKGQPGRPGVRWLVNEKRLKQQTGNRLCGNFFIRGDQVTAEVGTADSGASKTVTISNAPPKIVDISSIPEEIFAGKAITVVPVAEDADGDEISFTYQWLINGDADPLLNEATLPANSFTKGDTIQVQIVPNDFFDDGAVYESYAQLVPNAAPSITSEPPQGISSLDYRYQIVANDPDDNQLAYSLSDAPEGMLIDENSGLIQWSLINVSPGDYTIAIKVSDPEGAEAVQEYHLTLVAPE